MSYKVKVPSTIPPERNESFNFSASLRPGTSTVRVLLGIFLEGQETQDLRLQKSSHCGLVFIKWILWGHRYSAYNSIFMSSTLKVIIDIFGLISSTCQWFYFLHLSYISPLLFFCFFCFWLSITYYSILLLHLAFIFFSKFLYIYLHMHLEREMESKEEEREEGKSSSVMHKKVKMLVTQSFQFSMITWSIAHQAPLSMKFARQEYWNA